MRGVGLLGRVVQPPHGAALEGDAMSVVEEAVEDGVSEGGLHTKVAIWVVVGYPKGVTSTEDPNVGSPA